MASTDPRAHVHRAAALDSRDVTDVWGSISWLTDGARDGVDVTVGYVEIAPGQANPLHVHRTCSETLVLLEGRLRHVVGDDEVALAAGDVLVVPAGMAHRAANSGSGTARMVVVYDAGTRDFEAVG